MIRNPEMAHTPNAEGNNMPCPSCGNENHAFAKFCAHCGGALPPATGAATFEHAGRNMPAHSREFFQAVIGDKHQDYYASAFQRFDRNGKTGISWNWAAFFTTFLWLMCRRMDNKAVIYILLHWLCGLLMVIIIVMILAVFDDKVIANLLIRAMISLYILAWWLLPPLYANALYYHHCNKKITNTKKWLPDRQEQLDLLRRTGGVSKKGLFGGVLLCLAAFFFMAVGLDVDRDYKTRAWFSKAATFGGAAAGFIARYHDQHQAFPDSLAQAGFSETPPDSVKSITVNRQNGIVIITMATTPSSVTGIFSSDPFKDKKLLLVPSHNENNGFIWKCMSHEIPERAFHAACRDRIDDRYHEQPPPSARSR